MLTSTYAAGYYADHWVALVEPQRMTKVRAGAVVFATGVLEQPAVFRNNDLPGVMLGSAAQRLLHRHAIAPGERVVILTANREGYELARELRARAVKVLAVLDLRAGRVAMHGGDAQDSAHAVRADVAPVAGRRARAACCSAFEFTVAREDRARHARNPRAAMRCCSAWASRRPASCCRRRARPGSSTPRSSSMCRPNYRRACSPSGASTASTTIAARRQDGREARRRGCRQCAAREREVSARRAAAESAPGVAPVSGRSRIPRGKEFVDLDEDIQIRDLLNSVQEGFDSTELLKRYSTLGMGPSQGKHSNVHGARILMRTRNATLADTALTTQRPFYHPVPLKHLAGRGFHVHRHSAVHERHAALGAQLDDRGRLAAARVLPAADSRGCPCLHRRRSARCAPVRGAHRCVDAGQDRGRSVPRPARFSIACTRARYAA